MKVNFFCCSSYPMPVYQGLISDSENFTLQKLHIIVDVLLIFLSTGNIHYSKEVKDYHISEIFTQQITLFYNIKVFERKSEYTRIEQKIT